MSGSQSISPGSSATPLTAQSALVDAMCHILGNTCRIARTTQSYSWNGRGLLASAARPILDRQADELHHATEAIAHHIRGLGGAAIFDYSDAVVAVNPPTVKDLPDNFDIMRFRLVEGHEQAVLSLRAADDVAVDDEEWSSRLILSERISRHREHAWRLRDMAF